MVRPCKYLFNQILKIVKVGCFYKVTLFRALFDDKTLHNCPTGYFLIIWNSKLRFNCFSEQEIANIRNILQIFSLKIPIHFNNYLKSYNIAIYVIERIKTIIRIPEKFKPFYKLRSLKDILFTLEQGRRKCNTCTSG